MNRFDELKKSGDDVAGRIINNIAHKTRYVFDHKRPDSIMISQDLYFQLEHSFQFFNENPMRTEKPTIFGLNIFIIQNKTNYINCLILGGDK